MVNFITVNIGNCIFNVTKSQKLNTISHILRYTMSSDDCVFLARQSIENFEYEIGIEWFKEAINRHSNNYLQNKVQILEQLRNISYEHGTN